MVRSFWNRTDNLHRYLPSCNQNALQTFKTHNFCFLSATDDLTIISGEVIYQGQCNSIILMLCTQESDAINKSFDGLFILFKSGQNLFPYVGSHRPPRSHIQMLSLTLNIVQQISTLEWYFGEWNTQSSKDVCRKGAGFWSGDCVQGCEGPRIKCCGCLSLPNLPI